MADLRAVGIVSFTFVCGVVCFLLAKANADKDGGDQMVLSSLTRLNTKCYDVNLFLVAYVSKCDSTMLWVTYSSTHTFGTRMDLFDSINFHPAER
jgi:hypothetical protein